MSRPPDLGERALADELQELEVADPLLCFMGRNGSSPRPQRISAYYADHVPTPLLRQRRIRAGWLWRTVLVLLTAAMALAAFRLGVEASERPGISASHLGTQLYYVIGLFVLGGLDLGVPAGGSPWARSMLWIAYFVAPVITTGAVIEGLLRTVKPAWWVERVLKAHLVIVGAGRLGMAYLEAVRAEEPNRVILLVGLDAEHPNVTEAMTRFGAHFHHGDITHRATRQALHLDRCHVLAGFGRFGQTILETLQNEAVGDLQTVVIVDLQADKKARLFDEQVGFKAGFARKVISGDVADPATWDLVRMAFEFDAPEGDAPPPFYVLACSDDELNLSSAVWLRRRDDNHARIVVRCFRASLFARTLAEETGFEVFGIASLLRRSLGARHRGWFGG